MIHIYEVGGSIRDELLGLSSKDRDFAVEAKSFGEMREIILSLEGNIFLEKPEFGTIRAKIGGKVSDYVLCRKDGYYSDSRHPDTVQAGTILDDLARRDFTMNAIARNIVTGEIIDPYNGRMDIGNRVIRCVNSAYDRINEDPLRLVRAARFCITKYMDVSTDILELFGDMDILMKIQYSVSKERIREELFKMFETDSFRSIMFISKYPNFARCVLGGAIWLKPTLESR